MRKVIESYGRVFRKNIQQALTAKHIEYRTEDQGQGVLSFYVEDALLTKAKKAIKEFYDNQGKGIEPTLVEEEEYMGEEEEGEEEGDF